MVNARYSAAVASDDDLTAKARIRNAALELHGRKGEAGTTVREVAQAAGVTHGLVVHHFGTKDGLRRAVQRHVVNQVRDAVAAVPPSGSAREVGAARDASVARLWTEHPELLRYLRRVLLDPAEDGAELLDLLTDLTLTSVRELRAAGVATSDAPAEVQALGVLARELVPLLAEPVLRHAWTRLTRDRGGSVPRLDIRLAE
jgi:AcrR family transcriptional regulator